MFPSVVNSRRKFYGGPAPPAPPPVLWTPAYFAVPPALWSNETSAITIVGGTAASTLADIGLNGWHWGATGNPTIGVGPNGLRSLIFNGSSKRMTTSAAGAKDIFRFKSGATVSALYKKNPQSAGIRYLFLAETPTNGVTRMGVCAGHVGDGDAPQLRVRRQDGEGVSALTSGVAYDSSFHMRCDVMDWANGAGFIWKDDAVDVSNLGLTTSGNTSNTSSGNDLSLASTANGSSFAAIELVEIIVFDYAMTSADIRKVFGYMAWRAGLEANLQPDSPYLSGPPTV